MTSIIEDPTAARAWRDTDSLRALGYLTADWLQGKLAEHPANFGTPDDETADLIPTLVRANTSRAATFVTDSSQPGHGPVEGYDGRMWLQRAYVSGYAYEHDLGRYFAAFANRPGLIFKVRQPGPATRTPRLDRDHFPVAIRQVDQLPDSPCEVMTTAGMAPPRTELTAIYRGTIGAGAYEQLREAWYVTIAEVEYDDGGLLWRVLDDLFAPSGDGG